MMPAPLHSSSLPNQSALVAAQDGYVYAGSQMLGLAPKEHAVLHLLLQRAPGAVSKNDFSIIVWNGRGMSDDSLSRCIYKIRNQLRHLSGAGKIFPVYGQGYRYEHPTHIRTQRDSLATSLVKVDSRYTEQYLHARQLSQQRTEFSVAQAKKILHKLIEICPDFALARVSLAETIAGSSTWGVAADIASLESCLSSLEHAESIDPHVYGLQATRAYLLDRLWRFDEADQVFAQALAETPDDVEVNFQAGWHFLATGQVEKAQLLLRQAVKLHPYSTLLRVTLARSLAHAGSLQEALEEIHITVRHEPTSLLGLTCCVSLELQISPHKAMIDRAREIASSPHAPPIALPTLTYGLAALGHQKEARELIETCLTCSTANPSLSAMHNSALLQLGDIEAAFRLVEKAVQARSALIPVLLRDPLNAGLRRHPAFKTLWKQVFS